MKLTIKQLLESTNAAKGRPSALGIIGAAPKVPIKPGYWIGKVLRKADAEIAEYDSRRVKLWETVGAKKNEKTGNFEPTAEQVVEFNKQHEELLSIEIEFAGIDPINIEALGEAEIPPAVLATLDWMIVE